MSSSIYVGNLPYSVNETSLNEIFSPYGSVLSVKIITDMNTGRSKGFGFVEMSSDEESNAAIKELDNAELDGRNIKVNLAKPKEDRGSGGRPRRDNNNRNFSRR
jgi:cold-inducible RNA-binding protein